MRTIASKAAAAVILSLLSTGAKADVYTGSDYSVSDQGCYKGSGGLSLQGTSSSQSVAKCQQTCIQGQYSVMAMTSQNACYCGNSLPTSSKSDSSQCSASCFGYPSDICGSTDGTYFSVWLTGYGTVDGSSSSSSAVSSSSSSASSSSASSSSSSSSSSLSSSTSSSSTSSTISSGSSPSTVYITSVPTSSATSRTSSAPSSEGSNTIFVTQTVENSASTSTSASPTSSSTASASATGAAKTGSKGVSGGAVAGIVVGCVCGISAIAGSIFFLCYRKRIKGDHESSFFHSPQSNFTGPEDKLSFNSDTLAMAVDQRLNPVMLGRRLSEGSLADDRDYSRKILRIANPDDI